MSRRLIGILATLALVIGAMPMTATAAAPDTARVSATSYVDLSGNGSPDLCGDGTEVNVTVNYSGVGSNLGGSGTGTMTLYSSFKGVSLFGLIEAGGETLFVEIDADSFCLSSGYALVMGRFVAGLASEIPTALEQSAALEEGEIVCGSVGGYIQDGVHRNQGRVSLTLSASEPEACLR